jgi:hypothetical protein
VHVLSCFWISTGDALTPGIGVVQARMLHTGVVAATLPWAEARRVLAVRLRARVAETVLQAQLLQADPGLRQAEAFALLASWRSASLEAATTAAAATDSSPNGDNIGPSKRAEACKAGCHLQILKEDEAFLRWLSDSGNVTIEADVRAVKQGAVACTLRSLLGSGLDDAGIVAALQSALCGQPELRSKVIEALSGQ